MIIQKLMLFTKNIAVFLNNNYIVICKCIVKALHLFEKKPPKVCLYPRHIWIICFFVSLTDVSVIGYNGRIYKNSLN